MTASIPIIRINGWVSTQDELPKPYTNVLVFCSSGVQRVMYHFRSGGQVMWQPFEHQNSSRTRSRITHWMPLPKGPQA